MRLWTSQSASERQDLPAWSPGKFRIGIRRNPALHNHDHDPYSSGASNHVYSSGDQICSSTHSILANSAPLGHFSQSRSTHEVAGQSLQFFPEDDCSNSQQMLQEWEALMKCQWQGDDPWTNGPCLSGLGFGGQVGWQPVQQDSLGSNPWMQPWQQESHNRLHQEQLQQGQLQQEQLAQSQLQQEQQWQSWQAWHCTPRTFAHPHSMNKDDVEPCSPKSGDLVFSDSRPSQFGEREREPDAVLEAGPLGTRSAPVDDQQLGEHTPALQYNPNAGYEIGGVDVRSKSDVTSSAAMVSSSNSSSSRSTSRIGLRFSSLSAVLGRARKAETPRGPPKVRVFEDSGESAGSDSEEEVWVVAAASASTASRSGTRTVCSRSCSSTCPAPRRPREVLLAAAASEAIPAATTAATAEVAEDGSKTFAASEPGVCRASSATVLSSTTSKTSPAPASSAFERFLVGFPSSPPKPQPRCQLQLHYDNGCFRAGPPRLPRGRCRGLPPPPPKQDSTGGTSGPRYGRTLPVGYAVAPDRSGREESPEVIVLDEAHGDAGGTGGAWPSLQEPIVARPAKKHNKPAFTKLGLFRGCSNKKRHISLLDSVDEGSGEELAKADAEGGGGSGGGASCTEVPRRSATTTAMPSSDPNEADFPGKEASSGSSSRMDDENLVECFCSSCGMLRSLPFQPSEGRPFVCNDVGLRCAVPDFPVSSEDEEGEAEQDEEEEEQGHHPLFDVLCIACGTHRQLPFQVSAASFECSSVGLDCLGCSPSPSSASMAGEGTTSVHPQHLQPISEESSGPDDDDGHEEQGKQEEELEDQVSNTEAATDCEAFCCSCGSLRELPCPLPARIEEGEDGEGGEELRGGREGGVGVAVIAASTMNRPHRRAFHCSDIGLTCHEEAAHKVAVLEDDDDDDDHCPVILEVRASDIANAEENRRASGNDGVAHQPLAGETGHSEELATKFTIPNTNLHTGLAMESLSLPDETRIVVDLPGSQGEGVVASAETNASTFGEVVGVRRGGDDRSVSATRESLPEPPMPIWGRPWQEASSESWLLDPGKSPGDTKRPDTDDQYTPAGVEDESNQATKPREVREEDDAEKEEEDEEEVVEVNDDDQERFENDDHQKGSSDHESDDFEMGQIRREEDEVEVASEDLKQLGIPESDEEDKQIENEIDNDDYDDEGEMEELFTVVCAQCGAVRALPFNGDSSFTCEVVGLTCEAKVFGACREELQELQELQELPIGHGIFLPSAGDAAACSSSSRGPSSSSSSSSLQVLLEALRNSEREISRTELLWKVLIYSLTAADTDLLFKEYDLPPPSPEELSKLSSSSLLSKRQTTLRTRQAMKAALKSKNKKGPVKRYLNNELVVVGKKEKYLKEEKETAEDRAKTSVELYVVGIGRGGRHAVKIAREEKKKGPRSHK